MKKLSNEELLVELEVPFPVDQVLWRVTNTANNRTRGQVVPYADPRAYTDRLNGLVTPQGWTRSYETTTMNNITRHKRNSEIVTGKILVVCKLTIEGLGTHSGTGEEWADEENAMTSAEAQAFKRACSCFGLGRCFYDFDAPWVDLDDKGRPKKAPAASKLVDPGKLAQGSTSVRKGQRRERKRYTVARGWWKQRPLERQRIPTAARTRLRQHGMETEIRARQQPKTSQGRSRLPPMVVPARMSQNRAKAQQRTATALTWTNAFPPWRNLSAASSTDGFYGNTAMPTSLTWYATSS